MRSVYDDERSDLPGCTGLMVLVLVLELSRYPSLVFGAGVVLDVCSSSEPAKQVL